MEPFRYHVFACQQEKPGNASCCTARGSAEVLDALRQELGRQGLTDAVQLTTCGSLGLCDRGPNLIVYPEGVWYAGVRAADVPEIVREHLRGGVPVERLVERDPEALKREITLNRAKALEAQRLAQAKVGERR
jgi:(2Fe-2S) ferredoxin